MPSPTPTRSACSPAAPQSRSRAWCSSTRGTWPATGPGFTWSNDNAFAARDLEADRRIDYVFVGWRKERGAGHVVDARVAAIEPIDGVHPSDHYAVVAELRY